MKPLLVLAALLFAAEASAQPNPLYVGQDSVGGKPRLQPPKPVLFFEAKAHWPSLGIDEPRTAWEYAQRGMYRQDDLEDVDGAVADYRTALDLDSHLLIARARLGTILLNRARVETSTTTAINEIDEAVHEFEEILHEQPHRAGMHKKIADAYALKYRLTNDPAIADMAITEYRAELAMAPRNQACHYALAFLLDGLGRPTEARDHIDRYLEQARYHSDPYPYRILRAERLRQRL